MTNTTKPITINGGWTKAPEHRGKCPSYTATGTDGEAIELRRTRPKSHYGASWILTATPVDGETLSRYLGRLDFAHAEHALLTYGEAGIGWGQK